MQKFGTDAGMLPFRFRPPPELTNASHLEARRTWEKNIKPKGLAAENFVKDKYNERKDGVPWRTKFRFAKEAKIEACEYMKELYFALKRVAMVEDRESFVNIVLLIENFLYGFYYMREEGEEGVEAEEADEADEAKEGEVQDPHKDTGTDVKGEGQEKKNSGK